MQLEIRPDPAEVGRARRWVRSRLAGSGVSDDEPLAETLILLVSELVTNAVVHTGCPAVLRLTFQGVCGTRTGSQGVAGGIVRLEVVDLSACPPAPRHAERDETNGRGLELVDGLADRWGWSPEGVGKRIWCELDRCPAPVPCGGGNAVAAPGVATAVVTAAAPTPAAATVAASVAATASAYGGMAAYEAV